MNGYESAQQRYDNQMPPEFAVVSDEFIVRHRMQSIFDNIGGPCAFLEPLMGNNGPADEQEITELISRCLVSPNSTLQKQIGSVFMRMAERYLRVQVESDIQSGDIDRSLGS